MTTPARNPGAKNAATVLQIAQPYSLMAEQSIVAALLLEPAQVHLEIADFLKEGHFYDPFCRAVFQKSIELLDLGLEIDSVVLSSRLEAVVEMTQEQIQEGLQEIFAAFPVVSNLKGWAEVIIDKHVERHLAQTGDLLAQMAHAQNLSREEKMSKAHQLLADVGSTMTKDTVKDTTQMLAMTMKMVEEYTKAGGKITGVPTGFKELDEATCGFGPGDLVIVGARPSMGKTAFALSLAKHVCAEVPLQERKGVMVFSMEMGAEQIGMRWLGVRARLSMSNLRAGRVSADELKRMQDALDEADEVPFYVEDAASQTVQELAIKARRQHAKTPLGMIMIDYLQLINDSGRANSSKTERVGDISRALKQLARELGIPIVALSQLSRDLEKRQDKRPVMSDLRESGAIEQDADVIMFIYRDQVYNPNSTDKGMAEIIISKQRNGPLATVRLAYDAPTTCFHDPIPGRNPF